MSDTTNSLSRPMLQPMRGPRKYSEGSVRAVCKKQRNRVDPPKWVGQVKETTYNSDGTSTYRTLQKTFSDIECTSYENGGEKRYRGVREANKALKEWRSELIENAEAEWERIQNPVDPEVERIRNLPVPEYVAEYVRRRLEDDEIERSTGSTWLHHVGYMQSLGKRTVATLAQKDLKAWNRELMHYGPEGKRLCYTTRLHVWQLCKSAFKDLVVSHVIASTPFDGLDNPKRGKTEPKSQPKPLDRESLGRLLAYLEKSGYSRSITAIELCLRTGMRRSEVAALRWQDVDLSTGEIRVCHSIGRGEEEYVKSPKNGEERTVSGTAELKRLLSNRLEVAKRDHELFGVEWSPERFVVGYPDGSWIRPSSLTTHWVRLSKRLNLVDINGKRASLHCLRHTFISYGLAYGVDSVTMGDLAGHRELSTQRKYAGALREAKQHAMDVLDDVYSEVRKNA